MALADPLHAHRADQVIHRTGRYALDIRLLDDRGQRLLGRPPRFQERREVASLPQLRDAQFDRADTGLPVAVTTAVALVHSRRTAFAVPGATQRVGLQFHNALRGKADHLAQEGRLGALLQQLAEGDLVVGHPRIKSGDGDPRVGVACGNPTLPRNTAVAAAVDK